MVTAHSNWCFANCALWRFIHLFNESEFMIEKHAPSLLPRTLPYWRDFDWTRKCKDALMTTWRVVGTTCGRYSARKPVGRRQWIKWWDIDPLPVPENQGHGIKLAGFSQMPSVVQVVRTGFNNHIPGLYTKSKRNSSCVSRIYYLSSASGVRFLVQPNGKSFACTHNAFKPTCVAMILSTALVLGGA